ncbi:Ppx/GppA phosphatase family protein [Clostridium cibarium]|uniref:Ppx/GppA family phosphatase n=1 Tax=Clostridium cibarium TaxID=2762247 RepID=A0ABR8PT64_9CLOT|nr:Ppx/GppA phosphatase family protein [Clostridium cibarium]MBD7911361.1 Ppx/GppA family phosphatase [Clostridium cibarium]
MEKTSVIVIGCNSISFLITQIQDNGYFKIIDELNSPIRLYYDLILNNKISNIKLEETLSILRSYKSLSKIHGSREPIVFSTSFLEKSKNKDEFVKVINENLDMEVTILNDLDIIYYNYLAVVNSIDLNNALLVDISGESTHISWMLNEAIKDSFTLPLGTLNLSYAFNLEDKILKEDLDNAILYIKKELSKINKFKGIKLNNIVGTGKTIHSIANLDKERKKYPLDIIHNYTTTDIDIQDIYNLLKCKSLAQRKRLYKLTPCMADIIVGGALILKEIVSYYDISNILICGRGLKEGIIFDYVYKNYCPVSNILDYNLYGIMENLNINKSHAEKLYYTTKELFTALKPLHHLDDGYHNIIKTASYLHDSGISVDYYNYHNHSFYMILNSYISGLTHRELLISSAIVASPKNSSYNFLSPTYGVLINKLDIKAIDKIGVLLSIAEGLNESFEDSIENIEVSIKENSVIIIISSKLDLKFQINRAMNASRMFHEIYDKNLLIYKK